MKRIITLLIVLALALAAYAGDIELREDHPREYVVQPGDTLWDIAARFLTRPWQWPAIWHANPQIDNPHLIFPGDVISLVFIGGEPRLMVDDTVRRLSPQVRREPIDGPITTLPLDAIEPFLRAPRVVSEEEFDALPYILANHERRILAGPGDLTLARGMEDARVGDEFVIARLAYQFVDRSEAVVGDRHMRRNAMRSGGAVAPPYERPSSEIWRNTAGRLAVFDYPVVGYELYEAARATVIQTGDPTILQVDQGRREVMAGDRVLPIDEFQLETLFLPRAMEPMPENGRVLSITESYYGVGRFQIVAINLGSEHGIQPGHMFSAFRPGQTMRDNQRYPRMSRAAFQSPERVHVTLPDEYSGLIMVFRPFEQISYAIVLDGTNAVRINDLLDHPDRKL